jgi:hypothetical protein
VNAETSLGRRAHIALAERGLLKRWPGLLIASGDDASERWRNIGTTESDEQVTAWVSEEGDVYCDDDPEAPASLTLAIVQGFVVVDDVASLGILRAAAGALFAPARLLFSRLSDRVSTDPYQVIASPAEGPGLLWSHRAASPEALIVATIEAAPIGGAP